MKKMMLAAALMLSCSTANAAIYAFSFNSEVSTYIFPNGATGDFDGLESPITADLTVDIPSIENADFSAFFNASGLSSTGGTLLMASARAGGVMSGIEPAAYGDFQFKTDANGNLISIFAIFAEDTPDFAFGLTRAVWGTSNADVYEATGSWSVSPVAPVPLPAAAFLLLGAIGVLGATRRREIA